MFYVEQGDHYARPGFNPDNVKRVAVLEIGRFWKSKTEGSTLLWEALNYSLMDRGITCVERRRIAALVREQQMIDKDFADLGDVERAQRLGQLLNVDVVLYGDNLMAEHEYQHRMIDKFVWLIPIGTVFLGMPVASIIGLVSTDTLAGIPAPVWVGGAVFTMGGGGVAWGFARKREPADKQANETGTLPRLGSKVFDIWANSGTCVSLRAIDVSTGRIVWVGHKLIVANRQVELDNQHELSRFGVLVELADAIVDDFLNE
jgi:hypothetical protein